MTSEGPVPLLLGAHWHEDDPGGMHRYLGNLLTALRQRGLPAWAVVLGPAAQAPVGVVAAGRLDDPLPFRLYRYAAAAERAAASCPTVVDAHFAMYAWWPTVLGRLRRLPLVVHFQGPWAEESAASGERSSARIAAKRRIERAVYRRARSIVVLSTAFKRVLVERYGIPPWRIEVVPPGVDLELFVPGQMAAAREELGLPLDAPIVVAVRRLVARMGLDVLIQAWAQVHTAVPEAQLLIVGEGPERSRLEDLARRHGASATLRFLGRVDEPTLVRCYQAADLSIVPTVALEGFGLVVLEALACGTPVVVTDAGGLPEGVVSLDPSLVVPAGDPDALARRITAALDGTDPAPERRRCRAHAETFSWSAIAERHDAVYARAAGGDPRRLRVVYVDHCAKLSGGELALLRLLPSLDVDAHVILGEAGPLVERLRQAGVSVEVMPIGGTAGHLHRSRVRPGAVPVSALVHSARYVARLALRLRGLQPDLVHTNSLKAAFFGGVAGRLAAVPVVWHIRDRISEDYLPSAARRLVQAAARFLPTAIIGNSRATLETLGPTGKTGVVVPSPLGFEPLPARTVAQEAPLRVGILGRVERWKGHHVFLDAFAKAFTEGAATAVVVGAPLFEGEAYQRELEAQVAALGLEGRVEFLGFCPEVQAELRGLDVLVHASTIPEPFGQVVVEGMAAGLPVVAADAGGPAEIITPGVDGLLYPPGDVDALARALQSLASDPPARVRLGEAARARARDFVPDRLAPVVMGVYREVVSLRPGASAD